MSKNTSTQPRAPQLTDLQAVVEGSAMDYRPQPGLNDLGPFRLEDAPNPHAQPHRVASVGDQHSGQAECHDCGWHTDPGDRQYMEHADAHREETR